MASEQIKLIQHHIRKRREQLSYSQEYMAAKLNMGQNSYSKLELGYTQLTLDRFLSICDLLALSPIDLINDSRSGDILFVID